MTVSYLTGQHCIIDCESNSMTVIAVRRGSSKYSMFVIANVMQIVVTLEYYSCPSKVKSYRQTINQLYPGVKVSSLQPQDADF